MFTLNEYLVCIFLKMMTMQSCKKAYRLAQAFLALKNSTKMRKSSNFCVNYPISNSRQNSVFSYLSLSKPTYCVWRLAQSFCAQPKNSTVAQAVHVDIPKFCSCTRAVRLQPKNQHSLGRKNSKSMLAVLAAFCISVTM